MTPIRVAHILPWPTVGGVEQATLRIMKLAGGEGLEHVAYCLNGDHAARELFAGAGCETACFEAVQPSLRHPGPWWRANRDLARGLRRRGITVVHCADILAAHFVSAAGRMAGVPVLCHVRNRFDEVTRRDRTFLWPVNHFAFVSRDTWKRFGYPVAKRKGSVIYDGIDIPRVPADAGESVRAEFGIAPEAPLVGMVARIAPQKDHETLLRAAARLGDSIPGLRFLMIGDRSGAASYREHDAKLEAMARQLGLNGRFVFTGHRSDVNRLMAALDIFALVTHQEGLPLVILEAMAMGKPVIATGIDGIPEIVRDGVTGLLHRHEDDEQLAGQIASLARDPTQRARLGEAGRNLVETSFTGSQFGANMRALYRRLRGAA